ncbi:Peptidyl-prolyl cis-trans isomerase fpr2 [Friedmanniomyces endolithicus]|uniref:peptidylprolyl isomerase n=1 Tax=Friedmanniomyces endolithicus TaxID=329885 RepID=A0AAN6KA61_9PEZI|nr:Peptidyl-prolyl cis-trans isomerase fpr2 [Friedmanniomyces endolithicus]KAK0787689.1 Peptidyl-prolyl cis-trans isomerase fpr2 [Friedmanniomyces endolithicus]KAK0816456.1 Peptidyl-prolyl cis-trans isomerase fpr2 [Friedmanniomyces endolithicus]KAK0816672.1 Peptidyl-prolyl cis-trans isomerase fpr2 [Friedmanniomyces endolithicus]KAK0849438.1 Peptidyl-prolyl cis-trans isomerase fpr2 [Friedmanniomyces endolithicus]
MRLSSVSAAITLLVASVSALDKPLDIQIEHSTECSRKSARGDKVEVHYRGTLAADGSEFDASYNRGTPLSFHVGKGQVIKGWDEGLLDMCPGDKRRLTIQPEWGYGAKGMGPIPANSVLVFETELVGIGGVKRDEL